MIRHGYYYPVEAAKALRHLNDSGELLGSAQIGISMGNRTAGKTVGWGIYIIWMYEQYKHTTILLTWTKDELENGYLQKWFENKILCVEDQDGLIQGFKKRHKIIYTTEAILIDGDPMIYGVAISMSEKFKDTAGVRNCHLILKDEAIQRGQRNVMIRGKSAMLRIMEIWQTAARGYPDAVNLCNLVFIANTSERDNWLFNDLDLNRYIRKDTKRTVKNGIFIEITENAAVAAEIESSMMGKIMQSSRSCEDYYESATHNAFTDNTAFIVPIGLDFSRLLVQFVIRETIIAVFRTDTGYHVSKIEEDSRSGVFTKENDCHRENTVFSYNPPYQRELISAYAKGLVTFQTQESKNLLLEFVGII